MTERAWTRADLERYRATGTTPEQVLLSTLDAKAKAPRMHVEDDLQAAIVAWLGYSLRPDVRFCHVPNGGRRDIREAKRMKAAGTVAGWPDLQLVWSSLHTVGITRDVPVGRVAFIEVKAPGGRLSPAQVDFESWCRERGIPHAVVRSLDEAVAVVKGWQLTKEKL